MASKNIKNFEIKLQKTGIMVIIAGMAVLLCLTFLLGVEVGKSLDTYPEKISSLPKKIFALISKPVKIDPDSSLDNTEEKEENDLSVQEKLKIKNSSDEKTIPNKQNFNTESAKIDQSIKNIEETKTTLKDKKGTSESNDKKPVLDVKKIEKKHKYIIHAASFKEKDKAYMLNKQIAELGVKPTIIPVELKDKGLWYRVIVSGLESKSKAQSVADQIAKKTGSKCTIREVKVSSDKQ
ncbi:MAG: SPOR domain-containing protein [Syntrophaceae bacterium]|nr:SPOR domain-containing protein [Syntrophaceae bacterium]